MSRIRIEAVLVSTFVSMGWSTPSARADFEPAWTWNRHDIFVWTTGAVDTTRGWEFTVSEPVEITAIGVFDVETLFGPGPTQLSFPGLAQQHEVALWTTADTVTPLATGIVEAGQATPLCQDGYRYAPIDPTQLTTGVNYVVAAFWPADDGSGNFDPYPDVLSSAAPVTNDPRVDLVQARFKLFGGPFEFPGNGQGGDTTAYLGLLNFRINTGACEPNPPADLTTTFQGGNGQAGNMFDLRALHPDGLTVDAWQINLGNDVTNDTPVHVSIYWRDGSFIGHENSPDGWTLLGETDVLSWGDNQPTPVPLGGLLLPFDQTIGVFITTDFITGNPPPLSPPELNYTNIPPAGTLFADGNLEITGGIGKANPPFTGDTFAARMWNGGVLYSVGGEALLGDMNCDGAVNIDDIPAMVLAQTDPALYASTYPGCDPLTGDFDESGTLSGADLQGFVLELIQP